MVGSTPLMQTKEHHKPLWVHPIIICAFSCCLIPSLAEFPSCKDDFETMRDCSAPKLSLVKHIIVYVMQSLTHLSAQAISGDHNDQISCRELEWSP